VVVYASGMGQTLTWIAAIALGVASVTALFLAGPAAAIPLGLVSMGLTWLATTENHEEA
jgi:hypothetical protein